MTKPLDAIEQPFLFAANEVPCLFLGAGDGKTLNDLARSDNSKNGRPHTIHLSDFALRHFTALHAINGGSQWCFPNRDDSAHVCVKTVTKQLGDRQRGDATPMSRRSPYTNALTLPGGKWTPHDLRRTAATLMTALGVLPEVAEKCLNHTEESRVKRTYQRHSYDAEKREAWRLLGERLELLTRGDGNVVTLKRRSGINQLAKNNQIG